MSGTNREYSRVTNSEFPRKYFCDIVGSKGDNFKNLNKKFDYTLPQEWLNEFSTIPGVDYFKVSGTTVWVYEDGDYFGYPVSCCVEVQRQLEQYHFGENKFWRK